MPSVSPHEVSPNIGNYQVARGFISIMLEGESVFTDCGSVSEMTSLVKPTKLEHYNPRQGVQTKDLVVVTRLEATLTFVMEEITARNLAFAVLGSPTESPPGTYTVDMYTTPLIYASLLFTPTNVAGPKWSIEYPLVIITPNKVMELISKGSGAWTELSFDADVLRDPHTGQFGIFTSTDIASP